jgi:plastocyanin
MKNILMAGFLIGWALVISGCASAPADTGAPAATSEPASGTVKVQMRGNMFLPGVLTVKAGTTVVWENIDFVSYNVKADDGSFRSGQISSSQPFRYTFSKAGTFRYYCDGNGGPGGKGMSGIIEVKP